MHVPRDDIAFQIAAGSHHQPVGADLPQNIAVNMQFAVAVEIALHGDGLGEVRGKRVGAALRAGRSKQRPGLRNGHRGTYPVPSQSPRSSPRYWPHLPCPASRAAGLAGNTGSAHIDNRISPDRFAGQIIVRKWWAVTGSNRRPYRCKRYALPTELTAPKARSGKVFSGFPAKSREPHPRRLITYRSARPNSLCGGFIPSSGQNCCLRNPS